jgi:hypothetical protein
MNQGTFVHRAKYTKDLMKKFNMAEVKRMSTLMSTVMSLGRDEDGEAVDQREHRSMIWLPLVPHGDTAGHSVRRVPVCALSGFPMLFALDDSSANLQLSQIHTRVWDLVFCFFFAGSCQIFKC